eukprot:5957707-Amphidinium_carterae.2
MMAIRPSTMTSSALPDSTCCRVIRIKKCTQGSWAVPWPTCRSSSHEILLEHAGLLKPWVSPQPTSAFVHVNFGRFVNMMKAK